MLKHGKIRDAILRNIVFEMARSVSICLSGLKRGRVRANEEAEGGERTMRRIQRKRTKGWKMPENTVYVGRPSKWGNPYKVTLVSHKGMEQELAIRAYEGWLSQKLIENPHFLDSLKGKDLACWCPLDKPCHTDVILKILEGETHE